MAPAVVSRALRAPIVAAACSIAVSIAESAVLIKTDDELWQRMLDENLKSVFLVTRDVTRRMAAGGVVVHVGSSVAARPGPGTAAYAAPTM